MFPVDSQLVPLFIIPLRVVSDAFAMLVKPTIERMVTIYYVITHENKLV